MGQDGKWLEKLRHQIAQSPEPVPGHPIVEISGFRRLLIENHRGVIGYSREQIRVRVNYGEICVSGTGLSLTHMSREVLVVTGAIACVNLHREVGRC